MAQEVENIQPSEATLGEAVALNYVWSAAIARLHLGRAGDIALAQELMAIVRAYPHDWRSK